MRQIFFGLLILFSLLLLSCTKTSSHKDFDKIMIIPEPQKVEWKNGQFQLLDEMFIYAGNDHNIGRKFAIEQLQDEWNNQLIISKNIENSGIVIGIFNENDLFEKYNSHKDKIGQEGYFLEINSNQIILVANTEVGIFYGIQSLKQIYRTRISDNQLPCLKIIDWPNLQYRGWQDDISRGPIPTLEYLKKQIRIMSEYKQNFFTLYTEHVFKLKKHPKIAPDDGITAEEIIELVTYANKYHIEIIGNFQSFGHFHHILKLPEYGHLGETKNGWVLSPAFDESYQFLKDAYDEIAPIYDSEFFNINCDETWGLGQGASAKMVDSIGVDGVYAYHINKINNLLKSHRKRIMMWGDIAVKNPDIIDKLPKDLIVLSWGYGPEESFDKEIIPFTKLGFDFMVCPGVGCWSKIWPEYESAVINISNYIRDGFHHGAMGVLNTTWDDDGENLFNYNWYPLIWGAECGWKVVDYKDKNSKKMNNRLNKFDKKFSPVFFHSNNEKLTDMLVKLSELGKYDVSRNLQNKRFWESISTTILTKHENEIETNIEELLASTTDILNTLENIESDKIKNADILEFAGFATERVKLIAEKELLGIKMSRALISGNNEMEKFQNDLNVLAKKVMELKSIYKDLWFQENRNWWLDTNLVKFDEFAEDLKKSYLNVKIEPSVSENAGFVKIELNKMFKNGEIYYTLDVSVPTESSIKYEKPFEINLESIIRVCGYLNGNYGRETQKNIYPHLALGKSITLKNQYHPNYPGGGIDGLINGEFGSSNFHDGKWQGFEGVDLDAVIDLGEKIQISEIRTKFLQAVGSWIFQPEKVEISISNDNENYKLIQGFENQIDEESPHSLTKDYIVEVKQKARYIKILGKNIGNCPDWHVGKDGKAWIFIDELVVK